MAPILNIIIPCYNEETVLPITAPLFLTKINDLIAMHKIDPQSRVIFINDGSTDSTWNIICNLSHNNTIFKGISLSRNRGHQNALLAGLMERKDKCDITISIDCDGQDDINAIDLMIDEYLSGSDIVYGVRDNRDTDSFFKRTSAQGFYKLLQKMGAEVIYNHADYRLISSKALNALESFKEVNLYLRGLIPLIGFKSSCVYYKRQERIAGKSHYPLKKMLALAFNGITSLSIKPIRLITGMGIIVALFSLIGIIWAIIEALLGNTVEGWASLACIVCFLGGIQLISLGVIGEYVGKTYMETKHRPRYVISDKTDDR